MCGMLYQPWTQNKGQIAAQKVLSLADPKTGQIMSWPCKWPQSAEDGWLNKTLELRARNVETGEDLKAFLAKTSISLSDLLDREAMPLGFRKMEWNSHIESKLSDNKYQHSQWAHLKANGFFGEKLLMDLDTPVFENWTELIGLLASLLAGGNALCSKL